MNSAFHVDVVGESTRKMVLRGTTSYPGKAHAADEYDPTKEHFQVAHSMYRPQWLQWCR